MNKSIAIETELIDLFAAKRQREAIALARFILSSSGPGASAAVFRAMAALNIVSLIPEAIEFVMCRSGEAAFSAIYALGRVGAKRAVPCIARVLKNRRRSTRLREIAAEALGEIGGPAAEQALIAALSDKSPEVRYFAAYSLRLVGTTGSLDPLKVTSRTDVGSHSAYGEVAVEARRAVRAIRGKAEKL